MIINCCRFFSLSFLLVSTTILAQSQAEFYLHEIVDAVESQHPKTVAARLKVEASRQKALSARGAFDPTLFFGGNSETGLKDNSFATAGLQQQTSLWGSKVEAGYERSRGSFESYRLVRDTAPEGDVYAKVLLPILQGGYYDQYRLDRDRADLAIQVSEQDANVNIFALTYDATQAYWELQLAHSAEQLFAQMLQQAQQLNGFIEREVSLGNRREIDLVENKTILSNREAQHEMALGAMSAALEKIRFYTADESFEINAPTFDPLPKNSTPYALLQDNICGRTHWYAESPTLLTYQLGQDVVELDKKLGTAIILPRLDLSAKVTQSGLDWGSNYFYFVGLEGDIALPARKGRGLRSEAILKMRSISAERNSKQLEIQQNCKSLYERLSALDRSIVHLSDRVEAMTTLSEAARTEFRLGTGDMFLVNMRESVEIESRIQLLQAQMQREAIILSIFYNAERPPREYLSERFLTSE